VQPDVEVTHSHEGAVCHLSIPGGAFTTRTARQLSDALDKVHEDRNIRVLVLGARMSPFCSGPADTLDRLAADPAAALAMLRPPIIARISGGCHSVGLELALATDIRICELDTTFSLAEVHAGALPMWGGTQRLSRAIRPAEATAMILTGSSIDAERALGLGLVHEVAGTETDLDTKVSATVATLVALGPLALELTKEAVHRGSELPLRDGLRLEGDLNHQLAATEDRAEGLQAFFDKRPPDFSGR
jgi:enoyl-CoA hydratase/carnithine racemase